MLRVAFTWTQAFYAKPTEESKMPRQLPCEDMVKADAAANYKSKDCVNGDMRKSITRCFVAKAMLIVDKS